MLKKFRDLEPAKGKDELENEQAWEVVQDVALLNLAMNGGIGVDIGGGLIW